MSCPAQHEPVRFDRFAMIVELERDADHLGAGARGQRGDDRAVDPARHGDDDPRSRGRAVKAEIDLHRALAALYPKFTPDR